MEPIENPHFRIMCNMWGVDHAIEVAKYMGMAPSKEQIEECRKAEEKLYKLQLEVFSKTQEEEI